METLGKTCHYWEDDEGDGWLLMLHWVDIDEKIVCAGFTVRSWASEMESFSTGDRRARALEDTPRPVAWYRIRKQLPLARIITEERAAWAASALSKGNEIADWYRARGAREQAQAAGRRALRRAERWGGTSGRRRKYTAEDWRRIAAVADVAREEGTPQSRAVASYLDCRNPSPRDLARMRKLIQRARDYVRSTETQQAEDKEDSL
jgi:hypothetical protein